MYIVFDTETTGKAKSFSAPVHDFNNWPRMVQIAWKVFDQDGIEIDSQNLIIKPKGFTIPDEAIAIHRITNEIAKEKGIPLREALEKFALAIKNNKYLIAHNITFDENVVGCEYLREGMHNCLPDIEHIDTMTRTTEFVGIPNTRKGGFKYPSMTELHKKLFGVGFEGAHDALVDVSALAKCFFKLQEIGVFGFKGDREESVSAESLVKDSSFSFEETSDISDFVPLGLHTYHSILEGAGSVDEYISKAKKNKHSALAITDSATLSGTFEFYNKCKSNDIKPIFGIEMLLNDNIGKFEDKKYEGDNFKIKIFIKNKEGYENLNKLLYLANTEGYYKQGRITTNWLLENKKGLIVSTSCVDSRLASFVLMGREVDAENYFNMLRSEFEDDLIIELKMNKFSTQKRFNNFLLKMFKKYGTTPVLTNDVFYPEKDDSILQDVLASLKQQRPITFASLKENRELWYFEYSDFLDINSKYEFKYPKKFIDFCLKNTIKIAEKCNFEFETGIEKYPRYEPTEDVVKYFKTDVPEEIIKKLAFAKLKQKLKKYQENKLVEVTKEKISEYVDRLNYELHVIESKKMLDYFLVNWEIINFYRKQGYDIGPARGCFQIGSRVKMSDGMYAPIETVHPGDEVIDAFGNNQHVINRFEYDIEEEVIELEFDNGKKITCTLDHEILTNNRGWVAAKDLTEYDDVVEV